MGVAVYSTVLAVSAHYGAAFLAAALLVVALSLPAVHQTRPQR
jgi:hypothetical protein